LPRAARHSYDFFLLRRIEGTPPAALISKWTIPTEQVPDGGELRGLLEYDPATRAATVTIEAVGSRHVVLKDRVRLSP
jgi:hypothetical protein